MEVTKRKVGGSAAEANADDGGSDPVASRGKQLQAANAAGSLQTDKPNLKLEQLDLLFQDPIFQLGTGESIQCLLLVIILACHACLIILGCSRA